MNTFEKPLYLIGGIVSAYVLYCILYKDILVVETKIRKAVCANKNL
jgi:hypothetical protein